MSLLKTQMEPYVRKALAEDLGGGDITSELLIDDAQTTKADVVARKAGVVAGLELAALTFALVDSRLQWTAHKQDGDKIAAGEKLATIAGSARMILSAERTALNFLTHLSGIASFTNKMLTEARKGNPKVQLYCTRKTTPLLRLLDRYAVRCGGGGNHRFNLSDGILIKDNHLALHPSIEAAVLEARKGAPALIKIEVEADTLAQVEAIIASKADAILLDNMKPSELKEAVKLIDGRLVTEASGSVSLDNIAEIAATGVDIISSGALTHSAPHLDIGLDVVLDKGEKK